jgi:hypothetical protein
MASFKLDRTAFRAQPVKEASAYHAEYYKKLTWQERLRVANYLNSVAYNYPEHQSPRLDRTVFKVRSRNKNG